MEVSRKRQGTLFWNLFYARSMTSCFVVVVVCLFFNSFYFALDCFILLVGRDLLTGLGGHCAF